MKIKIDNYSFDASAKTITFTDYTAIRLDCLLLITNVTDNIIVYNFADSSKGGSVLTNVLTLTFDTGSMGDTDKLLIYYDDSEIENATVIKQNEIIDEISNKDIMIALRLLIYQIANPGFLDKTSNQLRAQVTGSVAVSSATFAANQDLRTLTTVTTVGNQSNMDGYQGKLLVVGINNTSWQLTVRNKIS